MITKLDLQYLGAIRTPDDFHYGGSPMSLDLHVGEIVLFDRDRRVGRLKLVRPQQPLSRSTGDKQLLDLASVPLAPFVDSALKLADPSGATWGEVNNPDIAQGDGPQGFHVLGTKAICAGGIYYDAGHSQDRSLFLSPWPLSTTPAHARTPWRSVKGIGEGWVAGPIAIIPERWRAALKGDTIVGQPGGLPIISRQSYGPAAIAIHAGDLETTEDIAGTLLLGYREGQGWKWGGPANDFWNSATKYNAIVFIGDFLVFIGRHGYGTPCYGTGQECGDPTSDSKGTHAYPYRVQGVGYSCHSLADVAAGKLQPHEPTAFWFPIEFPIFEHPYYKLAPGTIPAVDVIGAGYDSEKGELYVGAYAQDSNGWEPGPLVHVYAMQGTARYDHPRGAFETVPKLPSDNLSNLQVELDAIRAEVLRLRGELEEAKELVADAEGRHAAMGQQLGEELAAHRATRETLERYQTAVRAVHVAAMSLKGLVDEIAEM